MGEGVVCVLLCLPLLTCMKMWSVSAMSMYSSVICLGQFARSCVIACGRFITGKPISHVF